MTAITYNTDVVAWARQQAQLLRAGRFDALDIEHIADEIEDVGKSEQRELENRMAVLVAHLLKWAYQPERRGNSWRRTIQEQRRAIARRLEKTPSLKPDLRNSEWWEDVFGDAVSAVLAEVELDNLPETCPWSVDEVLRQEFWPD